MWKWIRFRFNTANIYIYWSFNVGQNSSLMIRVNSTIFLHYCNSNVIQIFFTKDFITKLQTSQVWVLLQIFFYFVIVARFVSVNKCKRAVMRHNYKVNTGRQRDPLILFCKGLTPNFEVALRPTWMRFNCYH